MHATKRRPGAAYTRGWGAALLAVGVALGAGTAHAHATAPALRSATIQVDGDGFVYVVNPDNDSVSRLTPLSAGGAQAVMWEQTTGDYPRTLALAAGSVYTANQNDDTLRRLRASDGAPQGEPKNLGFGCAPYGIAANQDGTRLYVACQGTQELVVLDPALGEVARIALDWPMPRTVLVSGDDTRVYVAHFVTAEPNHDAHVSEIDATANALTSRRYLTIPADRSTCETQNSGQGVTNLVTALGMTPPGSPAAVANQLWVGGTMQNNLTKGLFRRWSGWSEADRQRLRLFDLPCPESDDSVSCLFESFPRGDDILAIKRNVYKVSFHDVTRFVIWKLDLGTGQVVGKIDVDEANNASDITFSTDGATAYAVDLMFNSYHVFNAERGQGPGCVAGGGACNPGTLFAPVAKFGPFGQSPDLPCDHDALGSVTGEGPYRLPPQAQITPIDAGDPVRVVKAMPAAGTPVNTGVDFDTRKYHEIGVAEMRSVPDAAGTAPIGVALSPDGCIAYVHNYLSRNVVAISARPDAASCGAYDPIVGFRCSGDLTESCARDNDCTAGAGFCNHPGGPTCATDADCETEPCVTSNSCIPLVASPNPVRTAALVTDEVPAEILDGKILFNTAARDSSVVNGIGLGLPAPFFNDVRRGCGYNAARECKSALNCAFCSDQDPLTTPPACTVDADCAPGAACVLDRFFCDNNPAVTCESAADCGGSPCVSASCDVVTSLPGEVVSAAHDASYVTCTACHVDFGGQDGRTWDFSQFGASLRNTMDLRGRSQAAPGTCASGLSGDPAKVGSACHFDAACGKSCEGGTRDGEPCVTTDPDALLPGNDCPGGGVCKASGPGACVANPAMTPPHLDAENKARFFNPMVTVHWNGDRMEVEGFEFTYRSLLGAGDCDGLEHEPDQCMGALVPRSLLVSTAALPSDGSFEGDLRSTLRNVMVDEPTLGKPVNASVRLTHMADFVYSLTAFPRNPFLGARGENPSAAAQRGRSLFNDGTTKCASCHNGPSAGNQLFTDKRPNPGFDPNQPPGADGNNPYVRHIVGSASLFDQTDPEAVASTNDTFQNKIVPIPGPRSGLLDYVTPVLNDVWNTPPFMHDGVAAALLDVVRPCNSVETDCDQKGLGRNLDDLHGVTSTLTPQQLNDLVAFQKGPHNPVGATESVVKAGELMLSKVVIDLGKKAGRGKFKITGTARSGSLPVDPVAGGLTITLAVPGGEEMVLHEISAAVGEVGAKGSSFKYKAQRPTPTQGSITVTLKAKGGAFKVLIKGKQADLSALKTALEGRPADVTVALVAGETQFVKNRVLTSKQEGRKLVLARKN